MRPDFRADGYAIDLEHESVVDLDVAVSLCEREGYRMFGAAASWRLGQLQGGDEGASRCAAAELGGPALAKRELHRTKALGLLELDRDR